MLKSGKVFENKSLSFERDIDFTENYCIIKYMHREEIMKYVDKGIIRIDWDIQSNEKAKFGESMFERFFKNTDNVVNILLKAQEGSATDEEIAMANKQFASLVSNYVDLKTVAQGLFADSLDEYVRVAGNCLLIDNAEAYNQFPKGSKKREMTDRRIAVLRDIKDIECLRSFEHKPTAEKYEFAAKNYCEYAKTKDSNWQYTNKKYKEDAMQ